MAVEVELGGPVSAQHSVVVDLVAPDGSLVARLASEVERGVDGPSVFARGTARQPERWTAERPVLHRLHVELRDGSVVADRTELSVGLRTVEATEGYLLVNGKPVTSVRTAHYPNDERFYDLGDRHGLYVMDEANVETRGLVGDDVRLPANDPRFTEAFVLRGQRMAVRDRNHASVIT